MKDSEEKKDRTMERSGKRRRGAYQRHLLIYFAPVREGADAEKERKKGKEDPH